MGHGFKGGRGGANPLNFKVVGGLTAPDNPKGNILWVCTDKKITSWRLSAEQPAGSEEGMVWIKLAETATVELNALKKNGIIVHPISAHQFENDAWTEKDLQVYANGSPVDTYLQIYKLNDDCGYSWSCVAKAPYSDSSGVSFHAPTQSLSSTGGLKFTAYKDHSGMAYWDTPFDMTNFNTLAVYCKIVTDGSNRDGYCGIGVYTSIGSTLWSNQVARIRGAHEAEVYNIDVSGLTGNHYIGCPLWSLDETSGAASITIYDMKLM